MELYNKEGWIDIPAIKKACPKAFLFVLVGARQIGKTYGIIDYFHDCQEPYIYMRGTGEELQFSLSTKANLYTEKDFPWAAHMHIEKGKPTYVYDDEYSANDPAALALALSDVAKIRGFGGKRYKRIFYDEFIPEITAFNRKGAGEALKNAYVTINSNREVLGEPPCELWLAANSNNLDNDILAAFNITPRLLLMQKRKQRFCYIPERRMCLIMFDNSPISAKMQRTALFDCIGRTDDFSKMALENVFINDDDTGVKSMPIVEFLPLFRLDCITGYKHKVRNIWYFVENGEKVKPQYNSKNSTSYNAFMAWWKYYGNSLPIDGESFYYNTYTAKLTVYKLLKL